MKAFNHKPDCLSNLHRGGGSLQTNPCAERKTQTERVLPCIRYPALHWK